MKKNSLLNFLSDTGYKRNSPDVNRPLNVIPSGRITMQDVDFPVRGVDNLGNEMFMMPGEEYFFPGDYVVETPMMQRGGLTFQQYYTPAAESTGANYTPTMTVQAAERLKAIRDAQELARRKQAIQASQAAASRSFRERLTPENLAQETGATGDKLRFFPNDPNSFIDDYLNPLKMVGDMASGLGRIPLNVKQGNYGAAALDLAIPVATGALAGLGAKSAGQFVNNLANPLAGTGQFLTTKTPLKNAYKYNPWAFKPNHEAYYRGVGKEGIEDALKTGLIRSKNTDMFRQPYFARPGEFETALYYNPEALIEAKGFDVLNLKGKGPDIDLPKLNFAKRDAGALPVTPKYAEGILGKPETKDWYFDWDVESIPVNHPDIKLLQKDWLRGYKEVPKQLPGSPNAFKSEIDWAKWNPDTPKYPELINEYNAIEESTKKAGTWMKNPDGSVFQGTPEQFVQQQSSWFKKAFGDSKLVNPDGSPTFQYHGSAKKFDTFDESKFQLGDAGYSGKGIYTTPSKTTANSYTISSAKFHSGEIEPTVYQLYGQANNPISSSQLIKENKGRDLFNFHRDRNWKGALTPEESLRQYDAAISDQLPNVQNVRPWHDAREIVFPTNKQLKSAVGNVGFFDMSNPNIYKAAVPIAVVLGKTTKQEYQKGGQQVGTDILDKYKSYIMGDYKPEEEKDLKNTYDKLNRHYYKKAKETGKSVPNYIMSLL